MDTLGTLDPNATGVLPLLIGNATKISKYLINHDKEYEVVLQLGIKTSTADGEGEIIDKKNVQAKVYEENYVKSILHEFVGKQEQVPPMYSAIKINGRKLYDYARKGQTIEIKPRQIEIYNIELINLNSELQQIEFRVQCSKGTYIRSLCEDISAKLDTVGYMKELNRTKVGDFYIQKAVTINELEQKVEKQDFSNIITIEEIFNKTDKIVLDNKLLDKYLNGMKIHQEFKDGTYRIYINNKFIGLGTVKNQELKRDLVV